MITNDAEVYSAMVNKTHSTFLVKILDKGIQILYKKIKFIEAFCKCGTWFFTAWIPSKKFSTNKNYLIDGYFSEEVTDIHTLGGTFEKGRHIGVNFMATDVRPYYCSMKVPIWISNRSLGLSKSNKKGRNSSHWRNEIISRDKVCQCCGFDKHLEAHHIFSYRDNEKLRDKLENGITLCKFCHKKYHSAYGRDGANPKDLAEFMRRFGVR